MLAVGCLAGTRSASALTQMIPTAHRDTAVVPQEASWLLRRLRGQHSCKYQHADFRQLYTWVLKYIAVRLRHYRFPGFESGASRAYSPLRCPLKLHILKMLPTQRFLEISSFDKSIPF
jgi:hypothetical protein